MIDLRIETLYSDAVDLLIEQEDKLEARREKVHMAEKILKEVSVLGSIEAFALLGEIEMVCKQVKGVVYGSVGTFLMDIDAGCSMDTRMVFPIRTPLLNCLNLPLKRVIRMRSFI